MTSALRGRERVGQIVGGCVDLVLRRGREGVSQILTKGREVA